MGADTEKTSPDELLRLVCKLVAASVRAAEAARERERAQRSDGEWPLHLVLPQVVEVRVEIRKENAPHKEPHLHVSHSDKIDASLRIKDLTLIVGKIDRRTHRNLRDRLLSRRDALMEIWNALAEGNSMRAHELIKDI